MKNPELRYFQDEPKGSDDSLEKTLFRVTDKKNKLENYIAEEEIGIDATSRLHTYVSERIEELASNSGSLKLISLLGKINEGYEKIISNARAAKKHVTYNSEGDFHEKSVLHGIDLEKIQESTVEETIELEDYFNELKNVYPQEYEALLEVSSQEENRTN